MAQASTDNRQTRGLAEFVSGLRYERIPEEVRTRLKLLMLGSLGCALFGSGLEWSCILHRTLAAVVDLVLRLGRLEDGREVVQALALPRSTGFPARDGKGWGRVKCKRCPCVSPPTTPRRVEARPSA